MVWEKVKTGVKYEAIFIVQNFFLIFFSKVNCVYRLTIITVITIAISFTTSPTIVSTITTTDTTTNNNNHSLEFITPKP